LYVPIKQGGRGLMQFKAAHAVEIKKLVEHLEGKEDPLIQVVRTHQHNINSAVLQTARRLKTHRETKETKTAQQRKQKEDDKGEDARANAT
jgi:hypothetical protein